MSEIVTIKRKPTDTGDPSLASDLMSEKGITAKEIDIQNLESSEEQQDDLQPHLHARTFLAVFAVCLIYFAQDFAIVGAGAVSDVPISSLDYIY